MSTSNSTTRYMDTATAYDLWSEVYDTDGNFLQALDTIEMKKLLPDMLSLIKAPKPWRIVDLGCGTGRNTMLLLDQEDTEIVALDLSPKMLEIARRRIENASNNNTTAHLEVFDMLAAETIPTAAKHADAIISTLVLEHVPLEKYFAVVTEMLKQGGHLLLTNMHSKMGEISQAGFVDPKTGEKIRPTSYAHTVQATIAVAEQYDLKLVRPMDEITVTADMVPLLGSRAEKWVGVTVWFGGIFSKN